MRNRFILKPTAVYAALLTLFSAVPFFANAQVTLTRCAAGFPVSIPGNGGISQPLPNVIFNAADFATLTTPQVVDIEVEITWSHDGSCGGGANIDHSQVGFTLIDPVGTPRDLATSAANGPVSWTGAAGNSGTVTTFTFTGAGLSGGPPVTGAFAPNGPAMNSYWAQNPVGNWTVGVYHDGLGADANVCIQNVCITITACDANIPLTAVCNLTSALPLDSTGNATLVFADVDAGSNTSCILQSTTFTQSAFTCANVAVNVPVTVTLTDRLGRTAACATTVDVIDDIGPVVEECLLFPFNADTLYLDGTGNVVFDPITELTSSDACGVASELVWTGPGTTAATLNRNCTNRGPNNVRVVVRDVNNNIARQGAFDFCTVRIAVYDTVAPVAICQDTTVYLNAAGSFTIDSTFVDNGSSDNCTPFNSLLFGLNGSPSTLTFNCLNLGANAVNVMVSDNQTPSQGGANLATCVSNVSVLDTISPVALCTADTVFLDGTGNGSINASTIASLSTDNCGITSYLIGGAASVAYTCADVGVNPVTVIISDASSNTNTCATTVTVLDTVRPVMSCISINAPLTTTSVTITPTDVDGGSNDGCGAVGLTLNGQASLTFDCTDVGANNVTLIGTDVNGNVDSCIAVVTVQDLISPTALCQNITAQLDAAGNATVLPGQIDNLSTDNCSIASITFAAAAPSVAYTCANVGANAVTLEVTDVAGNLSTCNATITVADTVTPVISCNNITVQLSGAGSVNVIPGDVLTPVSTDACGIATETINTGAVATYNCSNVGANTANILVTDNNGNSSTCNVTITVEDNVNPTMICQPFTASIGAGGTVTVNPSDVDGGSNDACGAVALTLNGQASLSFDCTDIGTNNVTLIGTDINGNVDSCIAVVTVEDNILPNAICQNITAQLDAAGNATVLPGQIDNLSTDNCSIASITFAAAAPSVAYTCANIGANAVTLEVTDVAGNLSTCNATITVADTVTPVISCNNITVQLSGAGSVNVVPGDVLTPVSTDACGIATETINTIASVTYTCANVGVNNVTIEVTDNNSNVSTCNATVTVEDNTTPTMICQPFTASIGAGGTVTVNPSDVDGGSNDACGALTLTLNGQASLSFDCTDVGPNNVTLIGTDVNGNIDSCIAVVTVQDIIPPTAICQNLTAQLDAAGNATVTAAQIDNGSNDNCAITTIDFGGGISSIAYTCANIGANAIVLEVTDASGNLSTCNATVTVADTVTPVIACQNITVPLGAGTGTVNVVPGDILTTSSDACGIATETINTIASVTYTCANVGVNNVTIEVTDNNSNVSTCNATVTVEDVTNPTMVCQNITAQLGAGGTVTVLPADVDNGSSDNCGIATLTLNGQASLSFSCATTGPNNVTLIATDVNGNVDSCIAVVTVQDTVFPTAVCNNINVFLDGGGNASIITSDVDGGSTDNCAIATITINGVGVINYTCADVGPNNVTLDVTDASGNLSTCVAVVTVQDTVTPLIACQNITVPLGAGTGTVNVVPGDILTTSTDACGVASETINTIASVTYTCANVGVNNVIIEVTDNNSNVSTCNATVTVEDVTNPVLTCNNISVTLDAAGNVTVVPADVGTANDNCGIASFTINGQPSVTFNCATAGNNIVTLYATDVNGNIDSCSATVTVQDLIPPSAVCQNYNAFLDATGNVTVVPSDVDGGSTDNCAIVTYTVNAQPSVTFNCTNIGSPQNVTLEVTDAGGNTSNCIAVVTVLDTVSPVASCQVAPVVVNLNAAGLVVVPAATINNGSTDNCGTTSLLINNMAQDTFRCVDLGLNNVTLTVTDGSGNSSTCAAQVQVNDNLAPLALCASPTVYIGVLGNVTVTASQINGGSTDNCAITSETINGAATATYTCADLTSVIGSPMTATLVVSDASGNTATCPSSVTVEDTIAPNALCQNISVSLDPTTGQVTVTGAQINSGSNDNCNITTLLINGAPSIVYDCSNTGANVAVLTVIDESGNSSTCNATVTVNDATAPTANCQNITVYLDAAVGAGSVTVLPADIDNGSFDNCPPLVLQINNQPSFTYTCAQAGLTVPAQLTVTDPSGNASVCIAQVTVLDTVSPTAICNTPLDVYLGTGGTVTVTAGQVNNLSTDNCAITSININGTPNITFDCTDVGPNLVTLNVRDASNNIGSCVSTVNVIDSLDPNAVCKNITVFLDGTGNVAVLPGDVDNGSTDNCGAPTLSFSSGASINFTCAEVGPNTVTLIATDGSGNIDSCSATVTVRDTVLPTAVCQNISVGLDPVTGLVTVPATAIDGGSTDNCSISTFLINGAPNANFSCTDVGANNVTLTVIDVNTNISTCSAVVTVVDTSAPVVLCQNITVQLDPTGNYTVTPADIDAGSTDNCAIATLTINGQASINYTCAEIGVNNVTLVATDVNGNVDSCLATVTVFDTVAPIAVCQNINLYLDAAGNGSIVPADVDGGSTDNCGIVTYTINSAATINYTCADVGANNVTLEVTDGSGNVNSCVAVVTVLDTVRPAVVCFNITRSLDATGVVGIPPVAVDGGSSDACGILTYTVSQDTFDCSHVGPNNVTLYVTDVNNNTDSCVAVVTIQDVTPPVAICQNITVDLNPGGTVTVLADSVNSGSSDACGIASLTINGQPSLTFTCADVGTQNVLFEVIDVNGNAATCTATITVRDTVPPNAVCQPTTVQLDVTGNVVVNVSAVNNGSNDNCGIATVLFNNGSPTINFNCANVGTNTVTLVVTDLNGNVDSCSTVVTVQDITGPNAICQAATVYVDTNGVAIVPAILVDNGSSDACGIDTMYVTPATLNCSNIASPATVTLTVIDINGNISTCTAQVTVVDTVSPTMNCVNRTVFLDAFGTVNVLPSQIDGGTLDACGIAQLLINGSNNQLYDCSDIGPNTAILSATDIHGNTNTCSAIVTVLDTVSPTPQCRAPFSVFVGATGNVTITPPNVDSLSTDNCAVNASAYLINGQPSITYTCANLTAIQNVILTVVDSSGNTNTCATQVTVRDTISPQANCQLSITRNLSSTSPGVITVNAIALNNGSIDNCTGSLTYLINGQPSFQYTCADIGPNIATLSVSDASGNTGTCTSTVNINDITPPTANCFATPINVDLDLIGQVTVLGTQLNNGSTDNCAATVFLINGAVSQTFTCTNIGNNVAVLTVRDSSGNQSTCSSVINVRDLIAPTAICPTQPVNAYLDGTGLVTVTGPMIDSASFDNCTITTQLINNTNSINYTCANIGLNNVVLTVRDQSNNANSCAAQVYVQDTVAPIARCRNITVNLNASTGIAIVNASTINNLTPQSSDNCGINTFLINNQPRDTFDCTNAGPNVATLTVIDNFGNQSTCQSTITILDNTPPVISCQNRTFYLDPAGQVQVLPTDVATGLDACGIVNWTIDNQTSATYFCASAGLNFQDTIRAFDASGNVSSCISTITISDTISPVASCQNITVQLDSFGSVTVLPLDINSGSSDNCSIVTYLINGQPSISFNCNDIGPNTVTLRVIDQSGNISQCTATVTVEDVIAPVITCQNITVQLDASGNVTVPAINLSTAPTSDACGPLTYTLNGTTATSISYNCTNTGANFVTLDVTDANGNVSSCNATITVEDITPPTVTCQPYTLYLDNSGNGSISFIDVIDLANTSDNCSIFLYSVNGSTTGNFFDCSDIGANVMTVVAQDPSGNTDTCFATVTVVDSVAPTVNCNPFTVNLTALGTYTLTLADLGVSSSDACGVDTTTITPNVITCSDIGVVPVSVLVTDVNGNQTICTSNVTVLLDGPVPSSNSPLCEGQTLTLFANPPATGFTYTYQWSGPNSFVDTVANPIITNVQALNSGDYRVTITPQGAPGCAIDSVVSVYINVVPPPTIAINGPLCEGSPAQLTLSNDTAYTGTTFTYQWYQNGTAVGPNNDTFDINPVSFSDTGSYTMIITVDGCSDTSAVGVPLVVYPLPVAFTPTFNLPCEGDSLIVYPNVPATGPFTYVWAATPNGYSSTDSLAVIPNAQLGDAGTYSVTITDVNTCTATSAVAVTIKPTPIQPDIQFNSPLCLDDVLLLTDNTTYTGVVNYIWYDPNSLTDTTPIAQYTIANGLEGAWGLVVVEDGCYSPLDTVDVVYEPAPLAVNDNFIVPFRDSITGMDVTLNDIVRSGFFIELVTDGTGGTATLNTFDATFDYTPGFIFYGVDSFTYQICDATCPTICDTATVILDIQLDQKCFMPNALSPNGDGINDELVIVCRDQFPNMEIQIFSRWGNLVYKGNPNGWNGQFNGNDLPDGTYFYVLNYGDGDQPDTGYIIINR